MQILFAEKNFMFSTSPESLPLITSINVSINCIAILVAISTLAIFFLFTDHNLRSG